MDSNCNGTVEFEELVEAIMPEMAVEVMLNQEQLMEVFRTFDHDGNGFITAVELANSMAKMGHKLSFRELTGMFREADVNGDGLISFPEFAAVMAKSAADFLGLPVALPLFLTAAAGSESLHFPLLKHKLISQCSH